jgi:hypothetical protein
VILRKLRAAFWLVLAIGVFDAVSACSLWRSVEESGTKPVPMSAVLQSLEADLSRTHPVILTDAQSSENDDSPPMVAIRTGIANIQCYDINPDDGKANPKLRLRNPLIPVVTGPLQLTVQGQLSAAGTITVGAPTSASGAGTITRQGQQQIMLPTTLVPLVNVPIFYLGQQFTSIQFNGGILSAYTLDKDLSAAESSEVTAYVTRSINAMIGLKKVISFAFDQFDHHQEAWCSGRDGAQGPPIFIAIPSE